MNLLDRERWSELSPLLDHALELSAEDLKSWLADLSDKTPEVAASLSDLLAAEGRAEARSFLAGQPAATLAGSSLGPYTLERPLGHGGMGSVWLARRNDGRFDGHAALKIMNLALMSEAGQERFRREGTALARLAHPGIARLLDAGVAGTGQPYLVLEYVDGQRIDSWADAAHLTEHQRIELVLQVLDAVGHAHSNLIVHRDLKPSNILVTSSGLVKLLDFGIAKLLQGDDTKEQITLTVDGSRALTPDYAAPEQILGDDVTTATDVYAAGVLLYLLLSGRHPTRGDGHDPVDSVRRVLEVEPRSLGRGDLDLVIGKALRKAPGERYQTVAAFADDLRRYLNHEPVNARPDAVSYRARKFIRRHRAAIAGSTLVAASLVAATVFSLLQVRRADRERDLAVAAGRRATAMSELQTVLASDARDGSGQSMAQSDRIALAADVISGRFGGEPWLVAEILIDLAGQLYESGDRARERAMLARAKEVAHQGKEPALLALAHCRLIRSLWFDDLIDDAQGELQGASVALAEAGRSTDPKVLGSCLDARARVHQASGNADSAVYLMRQALETVPNVPDETWRMSRLNALGEILRLTGRYRDASIIHLEIVSDLVRDGYLNTELLPNATAFAASTLLDLGEFRRADSAVGDLVRRHEIVNGNGRVPLLLAFLHGWNKLRLDAVDSADRWIERAQAGPWAADGTMSNRMPSVLAEIRMQQGRLREARMAARGLPGGLRGRRATAALINALLEHRAGNAAAAARILEGELTTLYAESSTTLSLFTLPLVTAGEWRLTAGDARGADSLAQLGWRAALVDSLAATRSGLAGRAALLRARALTVLRDSSGARREADQAVLALANGYGAEHRWTTAARALVDSLAR